jgi:peptide/nickel transport system permease protein
LLTGVFAAAARGTWLDSLLRGTAAVLFSIPWFFAGVLLLLVFTSMIELFPSFGRLPPDTTYEPDTNFILVDAVLQNRYDLILPWLERIILPAAAVGITSAGFITRITRASLLETMSHDHVRTARAKGMDTKQLYRGHILPNAALPITTIVGLQVGGLLGGAVVSEVVFSYPGIGKTMIDTIASRDYPIVQGAAFVIATAYVLVNVITDEVYALLDPRIRR